MPLFNTDLMMATYTNDFGVDAENVPIKLTTEAPIPANTYANRPTTVCPSLGNLFKPRRLIAIFPEGIHEYPVPTIAGIPALVTALKTAGAICIDLAGERWTNVPNTVLTDPAFISTPYEVGDGTETDKVDGSNDKEVGSYDYTSDLGAVGTVSLRYNVEAKPALVATAQLSCLTNAVASTSSLCSAASLGVKPRYFTIKALVDGGKSLIRQAKVSSNNDLAACGGDISSVAFCLGYQGESIKALHLLV